MTANTLDSDKHALLDWKKFADTYTINYAKTHYVVISISYDFYKDDKGYKVPSYIEGVVTTLKGTTKYKCRIENLPRNTDYSLDLAHTICDCNNYYYNNYYSKSAKPTFELCSHVAALFLEYEKREGPILLPAGPLREKKMVYDVMVSVISRTVAVATYQAKYHFISAGSLSCFQNKSEIGLGYFDIRSYLDNRKTTTFVSRSVEEILKKAKAIDAEESTVEYKKHHGSTYLSVKLAFNFTAAHLYGKTLSLKLTEKEAIWQDVPDELNFLPESHYQNSILNETQIISLLWVWDYLNEHPVVIDETDDNALKFLRNIHRSYIDYESSHPEKETPAEEGSGLTVSLYPYLSDFSGSALHIGVKISISDNPRKYVVKDLNELLKAYHKQTEYLLGRTSAVKFAKDRLDPDSLKLMELLKRRYLAVYESSRDHMFYTVAPFPKNNAFSLTGMFLDEFYDLMENSFIYSNDLIENTLSVKHTPLSIPITITEKIMHDKVTKITVTGRIGSNIISSGKHRYTLTAENLSRIAPEEEKQMNLFADIIRKDHSFEFSVGIRGLNDFYHRVLPVLTASPCFSIIDKADKIAETVLPKPEFTFYMDLEDKRRCSNLTLFADVSYGDQVYHLGESKKKTGKPDTEIMDPGYQIPAEDEFRDAVYEKRIISVLDSIFSERLLSEQRRPNDPERYYWYEQMDDDNLFQFLNKSIDKLQYYGTIKGTERFNRLRITNVKGVRIGVSVDNDLLNISITSQEFSSDELADVLTSYSLKKKWHRLKSGIFVDLTTNEEIQEIVSMLEKIDVLPADIILKKTKVSLFRALYLDKLMENHEALAITRDQTFRQLIKNFNSVKDSEYDPPESLQHIMREYQIYGFKWLSTVKHCGFGGILADDMGLGKTLQMISVLLADKEEREKLKKEQAQEASENGIANPAEVPAPESVVIDTVSETISATVSETAPSSETASAEPEVSETQESAVPGNPPSDNSAPDSAAPQTAAAAINAAAENAASTVGVRKGNTLVVSPASLVYNWVEEIRRFAPELITIPLTASAALRKEALRASEKTDVYVISYDLLSKDIPLIREITFNNMIIDEAQYIKNPKSGYARSVKAVPARNRFALTGTPIENRLSELWSIFDFVMPGFLYTYGKFSEQFEVPITKCQDPEAMEKLKAMTSPFILRRKKTDVLKNLPGKMEEVFYTRISGEQQKVYDAQVMKMKKVISISSGSTKGEDKIRIIAELMRLRQICCDPSLVFSNYAGESAKREACLDLIESAVDGGHRILLFSQFTSMLELLKRDLDARGIEYYEITGSTTKEKRLDLVHDFNAGETPVFLISLKAGGTGLNLTGADTVIHYDPWWNLAAMNQATDRAHRIGQSKIVTVYKLIMKDTIEEKILKLQETKKDLAESILEGNTTSLMSLSAEELMDLLS
ncbi:DEAD/DEAH box helicase [Succinimonas sp.]|uniref:DEAD/DEAH box helicase n=1 Tax=Succinimonas sp. TaxID=1936151 RepID=UPI00386308F1